MDLKRVAQRLEQFEGCVPYMYLDTAKPPVVTCGIGMALPSVAHAQQLPWMVGGEPAEPADVREDYSRVMAAEPGMAAGFYERLTRCRLAPEECHRRLESFLEGLWGRVRVQLEADGLPVPAQEALMDMAFNLGVSGVMRKFPRMLAAITERNWEAAARESHRMGVGEKRNQAVAQLFREAKSAAAGA